MQKFERVQPMSRKGGIASPVATDSLLVGQESRNFLVQTCDYCKSSISLDVGDVVQGDRWYHDSCLRAMERLDSKNPEGNC
jgi:hypothetical protein